MYYILVEPRSFFTVTTVADEKAADTYIRTNIDELKHYGRMCLIYSSELRTSYCGLAAMKTYWYENGKIQSRVYSRESDQPISMCQ